MLLEQFLGEAPRVTRWSNSGWFAQEAYNVDVEYGDLRGVRSLVTLYSWPTSGPLIKKAWHIYDSTGASTWFGTDDETMSVVRSPLVNDAYDRWYVFSATAPPKMATYSEIAAGNITRDLGVPAPTNAPTLSASSTSAPAYDRAYVYTYVTSFGEETAPSPTAAVLVTEGGTVTVTGLSAGIPTIPGRTIDKVRVYRTVYFRGAANLFFVGEVSAGTDSFQDQTYSVEAALNGQLETLVNDAPPSGLRGVVSHPSGSLVGFVGSTVRFSVPYLPHAWPAEYSYAVEDDIIGLSVYGNSIAVMTKGHVTVIRGQHPALMRVYTFPNAAPCMSAGSIVGVDNGVLFASKRGLMLVSGTSLQNVTLREIPNVEWESMVSSSMYAAYYDGWYVAVTAPRVGFMLVPGKLGSLTRLAFDEDIVSIATDRLTGDAFLVGNRKAMRWYDPSADEVDYAWKMRPFTLAYPMSLASVQIHFTERTSEHSPAGAYPPQFPAAYAAMSKKDRVLLEVYGDDKLILTTEAADKELIRLPSSHKYDTYRLAVYGQCRVHRIEVEAHAGRHKKE